MAQAGQGGDEFHNLHSSAAQPASLSAASATALAGSFFAGLDASPGTLSLVA